MGGLLYGGVWCPQRAASGGIPADLDPDAAGHFGPYVADQQSVKALAQKRFAGRPLTPSQPHISSILVWKHSRQHSFTRSRSEERRVGKECRVGGWRYSGKARID